MLLNFNRYFKQKNIPFQCLNRCEAFSNYKHDDKAVFTFIENEGVGKTGESLEAKGDKFYFGSEGLFARIKENGSKADASSEEFKKYKEKLPKEMSAFRNAGK